MRVKKFQAKHIGDEQVLAVINIIIDAEWRRDVARGARTTKHHITAGRWDIVEAFRPVPWKIVQAKLTSMVRRGLIEGCAGCTCRGSFKVKEKS